MRNRNNDCKKKVYIRGLKRWVEMDEEPYRAYQNPIDAHRKRMQYHGRCRCPQKKVWLCDGECGLCAYAASGDVSSLDALLEGDGADVLEGSKLADFTTPEEVLLISDLYRSFGHAC